MQDTTYFKDKLQNMKKDIIHRLSKIEDSKTRKAGAIETDSEEQAKTIQNDEVIDRLELVERKELQQIDDALNRIKSGTYGTCTSCGEKISEKRLEALPFATICIHCMQEQ